MIKNLYIAFNLISILLIGQSSHFIPDSLIDSKYHRSSNIQGSCLLPNGGMNSIVGSPPSYAWLQANGYCNPGSYGSAGTVCWTFTPTGSNITINSGYSSTGCSVIFFGPFNLYSCAPVCTNLGSGLTYTVIPNQCYTWCMTYNGNGGGCSFSNFCPYYQQTGMLDIKYMEDTLKTSKNTIYKPKIKYITDMMGNDYKDIPKTYQGMLFIKYEDGTYRKYYKND